MADVDLQLIQGKTFRIVMRAESSVLRYKPVSAIDNTAPVVVHCVGHGIPDGWRVAVASAVGYTDLNQRSAGAPMQQDFRIATVVDADTVEFNAVNALRAKQHTPNTGVLVFYEPIDLTGCVARMVIRDRVGGTELDSFDHSNSLSVDEAAHTICLTIPAEATAEYKWTSGVYEVELVFSDMTVFRLLFGTVSVEKEVVY